MLNKRFGEKEFSAPKFRLIILLAFFSLSFFVRGTWDLMLYFNEHLHLHIKLNSYEMATMIFVVYFFTEWLPIFVIYLVHALAFYGFI